MANSSSGGATATKNVALTASGKPKEKRRNNEKRKEKSRDAARCRRSRETEIFSELASVLPLKKEDVNQLDKASIMRIAITYLKVHQMLDFFPNIKTQIDDANSKNNDVEVPQNDEKILKTTDGNTFDLLKCPDAYQTIKKTLDGFLLILSNDGDITYVSESVTDYLGLAKIDVLGQQIWEYSHQCDHAELKEALNIKRNGMTDKVKDEEILEEDSLSTDHRDLFVRFKCTLTSRGRSINIKSASYKVIHLTGHLIVNTHGERVLIAVGRPIPHPINIEVPLGSTTFMTKHSLDMKFTYVDEKMLCFLGFEPEDLIEKSLFICHHGSDTDSLMTTFKTVLSKGQGETYRYRFLGKYGGYCWIVTQATVVYDKLKPQSVVCVNYVISNLEKEHEIYSLEQYEASQTRIKSEELINNNNNNNNNNNKNNNKNIIKHNNNNNNNKENNNKEVKCNDEIEKSLSSTPPINTNQDIIKALSNDNNNSIEIIISDDSSNNKNIINNKTINQKPLQQQKATANVGDNNATAAASAAATTSTINVIKRINLPLLPTSPSATTTTTTIIPPTTTVTHKFLSKPNKTLSSPPRPKSVTASVFRAAPDILPNILTKNNYNNTNNNNNNNKNSTDINTTAKINNTITNNNNKVNNSFSKSIQLPINVSTRAQSVTASVLMPISQINNKPMQQQQQQLLNKNFNNKHSTTSNSATLAAVTPRQQGQRDMNKGFLTFAEDATNELTMLKEEPDDLAHLAPPSTTVVDACMPLDETTPLFGEMLAGLMGSYGSILPDDINSLDSTSEANKITRDTSAIVKTEATLKRNCNNNNNNNSNYNNNNSNNNANNNNNNDGNDTTTTAAKAAKTASLQSKSSAHIDPFINYREESNDTNCSQHLLSPSMTSTSPEASSLPSLCSPNSLSQEDEFAFMTMNVDDDIDLTTRAPYIPMNEQDDLPLLTADDLMWCSNNAFSSDDIQMQKDMADVMEQQFQQLQQIQAACDNAHLRGNLIDFISATSSSPGSSSSSSSQSHQQAGQLQQQQSHNNNNNNNFSNSLCSSPASTVSSSMSPSPSVGSLQQHQHQQQQQQQQDANSTNVFGSDSSELAALLCGAGNGTLSILGNSCDDDCSGIARNIDSSVNNVGNNVESVANFRQQMLLQQNDEQMQRQQQQQHQLISGLNIICKKEKFDASALASNLCDSIEDAFDNVYTKDSSNLDWNEFLPLNVNDSTNVAVTSDAMQRQLDLDFTNDNCKQQQQQQQQQLQQQRQEIILNAVPLMTIQNNKNILLQSQPQQTQERIIINNNSNSSNSNISSATTNTNLNKLIVNDEMLSSASTNANPRCTSKVATIKLINTPATLRVFDGNKLQQSQPARNQTATRTTIIQQTIATGQQQQQHHGNKRHINPNSMQFETKRLKSGNSIVESGLQAAPQLLQQLIAPIQQQQQQHQKLSMTEVKVEQQQQQQQRAWMAARNDLKQSQQQQQQQQSDSVLKNLLISGCDNLDTTKREPIYLDETSLDKGSPTSPFSNSPISPNDPTIGCLTSTASILRNYRHNPMIGGPGILPSPTFLHNEDSSSSPPELITAYDGIDSGDSDSGIDDSNSMDTSNIKVVGTCDTDATVKPLLKIDHIIEKQSQHNTGNGLLLMKCTNDAKNTLNHQSIDDPSISNENCIKRKASISFMDSSNPLLTPFLMDLCNDDYNMNSGEFSEENDIESVLNQWSTDMVV